MRVYNFPIGWFVGLLPLLFYRLPNFALHA